MFSSNPHPHSLREARTLPTKQTIAVPHVQDDQKQEPFHHPPVRPVRPVTPTGRGTGMISGNPELGGANFLGTTTMISKEPSRG